MKCLGYENHREAEFESNEFGAEPEIEEEFTATIEISIEDIRNITHAMSMYDDKDERQEEILNFLASVINNSKEVFKYA